MSSAATHPAPRIDVASVRREFPVLSRRLYDDKPLIYLDSAASSQKPRAVIDAIVDYYSRYHSNVHRGVHALATEATEAYELAREKVAAFIGAGSASECVFTRGTTESINLVAHAWATPRLQPGDELLVTEMEHHSNLVPWQMVAERTGARVVMAPIDDEGDLIIDAFRERLGPRTRVVALTHVSNVLGTVNPVSELCELAHAQGAIVVLDGAQSVPHMPVDVQALGCDFFAFSGHKMYGPTGIGVLWGRPELLEETAPWQGGGSMIHSVSFEKTTFAAPPTRFEAGTPNIEGAIGLGAAIDWMGAIGTDAIEAHESELIHYALDALTRIPSLRLIGRPRMHAGTISFVTDQIHPHDMGTFLDREGIAVRVGHHCAEPLMAHFDVPATTRASFGVHNGTDDIDALVAGIRGVVEFFS